MEALIEQGKIGGVVYKIMLLDDKYTVYILSEETTQNDRKMESEFSAVESFDDLASARAFVKSFEKRAKEE